MFQWIRNIRARKRAAKLEREQDAERMRLWREEQLKKCDKGEHDWEYQYEVQGDGDPNVEGYIEITRSTCRVCGESRVEIEPYDPEERNP